MLGFPVGLWRRTSLRHSEPVTAERLNDSPVVIPPPFQVWSAPPLGYCPLSPPATESPHDRIRISSCGVCGHTPRKTRRRTWTLLLPVAPVWTCTRPRWWCASTAADTADDPTRKSAPSPPCGTISSRCVIG